MTIQNAVATPKQVAKERTFVTLDGLRGIAAITIITRHAGYFASPFFESYLAVDFFFVLSGFVLSHAYGRRLRGDLSTIEFLKIRLIRLYPLYGLSLAMSSAVLATTAFTKSRPDMGSTALAIFFSALFLPTPGLKAAATLFPLNGTAWSLFFELTANAWWGSAWRRIKDLHLAIFVGAAGVVMIAAVLGKTAGFGFAPDTGVMDNGWQWGSIGAGFIRVGYSFFCGILLHRIWARQNTYFRVPPWVPFVTLIAVLTIRPPAAYQGMFDLVTTLFAFPLIVWTGASAPASGIVSSSFSILGIASYGVYILQAPLIDIFRRVNHVIWPATLHNSIAGVTCVAFVFATTLAADTYFDRPIRDWLSLHLRRPRHKP